METGPEGCATAMRLVSWMQDRHHHGCDGDLIISLPPNDAGALGAQGYGSQHRWLVRRLILKTATSPVERAQAAITLIANTNVSCKVRFCRNGQPALVRARRSQRLQLLGAGRTACAPSPAALVLAGPDSSRPGDKTFFLVPQHGELAGHACRRHYTGGGHVAVYHVNARGFIPSAAGDVNAGPQLTAVRVKARPQS